MEWFIFWLGLSMIAGGIASNKGRCGFCFFLLAVFLSPFIGIVAAVVAKRKDPNAPTPLTHVKCPDCRELVLKDARVCKHCGCKLVPQ